MFLVIEEKEDGTQVKQGPISEEEIASILKQTQGNGNRIQSCQRHWTSECALLRSALQV
jgi:hypothetical protein